jgi:hypothetical protein
VLRRWQHDVAYPFAHECGASIWLCLYRNAHGGNSSLLARLQRQSRA